MHVAFLNFTSQSTYRRLVMTLEQLFSKMKTRQNKWWHRASDITWIGISEALWMGQWLSLCTLIYFKTNLHKCIVHDTRFQLKCLTNFPFRFIFYAQSAQRMSSSLCRMKLFTSSETCFDPFCSNLSPEFLLLNISLIMFLTLTRSLIFMYPFHLIIQMTCPKFHS